MLSIAQTETAKTSNGPLLYHSISSSSSNESSVSFIFPFSTTTRTTTAEKGRRLGIEVARIDGEEGPERRRTKIILKIILAVLHFRLRSHVYSLKNRTASDSTGPFCRRRMGAEVRDGRKEKGLQV